MGVCHHLAEKQYVTGHGGNLAWKLEDDVILITPTKHNKGDVTRDNVVFINLIRKPSKGRLNQWETPMYVNFFRERLGCTGGAALPPPHLNAFAISDSKNCHMRPLFPETITEVGPVPVVLMASH